MRQRTLWPVGIGGFVTLAIASIIWPFIDNAKRPTPSSFKIPATYSQIATVEDAFDLSSQTRSFVVSEGPCAGDGCNGGVLSQQLPEDVPKFMAGLHHYDSESQSIIWLYQTKPVAVTRHHDVFGEDTATITGILTKDRKFYFAVVPNRIVEPHLQWIYVERK